MQMREEPLAVGAQGVGMVPWGQFDHIAHAELLG